MAFRDLFFKPTESGIKEGNDQIVAQETPSAPSVQGIPVNATESERYIGLFRDAIMSQESIGIKYIKLLYELSKEPTAADYKKAYSLLQIMDSTLSIESILSSLVESENMINSETDKYLKQGNAKKSELENNRKNERNALEAKIHEITTSIANLRKELDEKDKELTEKKAEVEKLDGKFTPELEKTVQTISAVSSASKMVLSSLSQIKDGINNNLK